MKNIKLISLSLFMLFSSNIVFADSFYNSDNRYRGFYWFERSNQYQDATKQTQDKITQITPEEALLSIEARKEQLDAARNVMIELAFRSDIDQEELYKAVKTYKELETKMFNGSLRLASAWQMANFIYPEFTNLTEEPVNVPANKLKRKLSIEERSKQLNQLAENYSLVLFTRDNCLYSKEFIPIAKRFADVYGFELEISDDEELMSRLGYEAIPTLVAVSTNQDSDFTEIIRGLATTSELEENSLLLTKLLQERKR